MQCFQYETMRRWLRARLRARGFQVHDDDLAIDDVLDGPGFDSISDVIRLNDARLDQIGHTLGYAHPAAA